ncbi:MAG: rhodanese-like domain-containing protein [Verrucomicrobiales bacterium]|nr:rhodanese-like domain-containing protein [Verrucomicrobiales bacterium]
MLLKQIYDEGLSQYSYLIGCPQEGEAIIVDPQRDIDRYQRIAKKNNLEITHVTETHIHADFLSGIREFLNESENVTVHLSDEGGENWKYDLLGTDNRVKPLVSGSKIEVGSVVLEALHTPGHTPEHLSFLVTDRSVDDPNVWFILSGDFIFIGDLGRPDLLEETGDGTSREDAAEDLYESARLLREERDDIVILPGHGAGSSCGKSLGSVPISSLGYEKRYSNALHLAMDGREDDFLENILSGQPEPPRYFSRMKKQNRDGQPLLGALPCPDKVIDIPDEAVIVDARDDRESFMDEHLENSIHAPLGSKFCEAVGSYLDSDELIVLLIENEDDLDVAIRMLVRMGYDRIGGYLMSDNVGKTKSRGLKSIKSVDITEIGSHRTVIDVRGSDEFNEAHIPGATNVPHTRIVADADRLPEIGSITVHCASGVRAAIAVSQLARMGYQVTYANGKFDDWAHQAATVASGDVGS